MGSEAQKKIGMERAGDLLRGAPEDLFIIGHDGDGETPAARVEWLKALFPKLAAKIDAVKNRGRADAEVPEWLAQAFNPRHAPPVQFENFCVSFPDGCGRWSGKPLLPVIDGRHRVKLYRATNARRAAEGGEQLKCRATQAKYHSPLDAQEAVAIGNARVEQSPSQRAWAAYEFQQAGKPLAAIAPLVGVTTEQAVRNLLVLCDASDAVRAAVDAGVENGGITQTAAQDIVRKGDHAAQDAELQKRLDAARNAGGRREKSKALRGDSEKVKPVSGKKLSKVDAALRTLDRGEMNDPHRVDEWLAILRWAQGDASGYDALPDEFRGAVLAAEKKVKAT